MGWAHRFRLAAVLSVLLICLLYLLPPIAWIGSDQRQYDHGTKPHENDTNNHAPAGTDIALPLPTVYSPELSDSKAAGLCGERYGTDYLRAFSKKATNYCDANSTADLTCFSHKASDDRTDSFCIGGPAIIDPAQRSIKLDCVVRDWNGDDATKDVPQLHRFPAYWYNTGPRAIFRQYIKLGREPGPTVEPKTEMKGFSFLVQREDNNQNLWHTMMEIMSLTMSLDVLRTTVDPSTGKAFFADKNLEMSQVVFLDSLVDGPFYDLWRISAKMPSLRLNEVASQNLASNVIVVPLPGGSNPLWQGDWADIDCGDSELLKTFSHRVLDFYGVSVRPPKSEKPLTLTVIDRKQKRRLLDQETYFAALQAKCPDIKMQVVDYTPLPFSEQVNVSHSTDILVGVHGAGLTHGMFLPPNSTIVEILPPNLKHKGFENMSKFLGHRHFSRHGSEHDSPENNGDWQHDDVFLEKDRFLELMEEAIASARR